MPQLPTRGGSGKGKEIEYELMSNITYLTKKTKMGYMEIINLPYSIFLSYLKYNRIFDLQQTEEGRKYLEQVERSKQTEPDIDSLRNLTGYKRK